MIISQHRLTFPPPSPAQLHTGNSHFQPHPASWRNHGNEMTHFTSYHFSRSRILLFFSEFTLPKFAPLTTSLFWIAFQFVHFSSFTFALPQHSKKFHFLYDFFFFFFWVSISFQFVHFWWKSSSNGGVRLRRRIRYLLISFAVPNKMEFLKQLYMVVTLNLKHLQGIFKMSDIFWMINNSKNNEYGFKLITLIII